MLWGTGRGNIFVAFGSTQHPHETLECFLAEVVDR